MALTINRGQPAMAERRVLTAQPKRKLHGMRGVWRDMLKRCYNPNEKEYHCYGGRGITVCARWRHSFETFDQDMSPRPEGMWLDRIDNDGHYEPGNCRWVTPLASAQNRKDSIWLEHDGKILPAKTWAKLVGISRQTLYRRLQVGMSTNEALTKPLHPRRGRWHRKPPPMLKLI